jgi:hypothetical protein
MTWPLKYEILFNSVQTSVPTSKRTKPVFATKLMCFRHIFVVDCQNHLKKITAEKMHSFRGFKCHVIWYILLPLGKSCTVTLGVMVSTLGNAVVVI